MHRTQVERTRRLRENNKKKGLVSITVTVPELEAEVIKALAKKMRESHAETTP